MKAVEVAQRAAEEVALRVEVAQRAAEEAALRVEVAQRVRAAQKKTEEVAPRARAGVARPKAAAVRKVLTALHSLAGSSSTAASRMVAARTRTGLQRCRGNSTTPGNYQSDIIWRRIICYYYYNILAKF